MLKLALFALPFLVLGTLPAWSYSASWGYAPSAGLGALLVVTITLELIGFLKRPDAQDKEEVASCETIPEDIGKTEIP